MPYSRVGVRNTYLGIPVHKLVVIGERVHVVESAWEKARARRGGAWRERAHVLRCAAVVAAPHRLASDHRGTDGPEHRSGPTARTHPPSDSPRGCPPAPLYCETSHILSYQPIQSRTITPEIFKKNTIAKALRETLLRKF